MVFGFYDAVGRGAFAGDVAVRGEGLVGCLLGGVGGEGKGDLQVDEFAFFVFHFGCVGGGG